MKIAESHAKIEFTLAGGEAKSSFFFTRKIIKLVKIRQKRITLNRSSGHKYSCEKKTFPNNRESVRSKRVMTNM